VLGINHQGKRTDVGIDDKVALMRMSLEMIWMGKKVFVARGQSHLKRKIPRGIH